VGHDRRGRCRPGANPEAQGGRGGDCRVPCQVDGLCQSGQASGNGDDRPGVAACRALKARGGRVRDEGQSVGDHGVEPGDGGRDLRGDGDLVEAVRGGGDRAGGDEQARQPQRHLCCPTRRARAVDIVLVGYRSDFSHGDAPVRRCGQEGRGGVVRRSVR
jgi:hypothetical protein